MPRLGPTDCKRNRTTCLLTALDVATGTVIGRTTACRSVEKFHAFPDHVAEGIEHGNRFTSF